MRRLSNAFVVVPSWLFLLFGLALSGCNSESGGDSVDDPPPATGMLRQVHDADELETTLKKALADVTETASPAFDVTGPGTTAGNFTGTYTVEAGVDELDLVRYDGAHLYIAPTHAGSPGPYAIRILRTDPGSASATPVGSIPLDDTRHVMGMYVANDRLFLVTSEAYFGPYGGVWPAVMIWAPTRFAVQVHDVRDPAHPRRLMAATIDGVFVESRRIDDRVIIVSRHAPRALLEPASRLRLASLSLRDLMPGISVDGRSDLLVEPRNCFVANEGASHGHAVLTSISTFSLSNPRDIDGICYDEPADGVYASREALYISEPRYSTGITASTRIHKFSLRGARPVYAGSAEVPGAVWRGGQQDFRLSESAGLLRVFTTEPTGDSTDFFDHRLFVLREKPGERALEIMARLPNDARPEEIGKPNENLFGVRFAGDRAYAVTFQRIDPLYVIDLSTPADPRIAGQLLVPGVSEFLHPVSNDLLLGLGSDGSRVKLELFDTSALEHPQSRGAITLGGITSSTPALHDRHAFAYLPGVSTDRFAVPGYVYHGQPGVGFGWAHSLLQFEIVGKQSASSAYLSAAGEVSPPTRETYGGLSDRSFINGDTVYYLYNGQVWGTFWSTPSQLNGPF